METQSLIYFIAGLVVGGTIAGLIASLLVRAQSVRAVTLLEAEKARLTGELEQLGRSAETSREQALSEKEAHVRSLLAAQEQAFRERLAEKDRAVEALLNEKDLAIAQQKRLLAETERVLSEKFNDLSIKSLDLASANFLKLAGERFEKAGEVSRAELEKRQLAIGELVKPVSEALSKLEKQHHEMEERRVSAFDAIENGLKTLSVEASQLGNALRKPASRGAWGEMNLQVILENAGLVQGEHFVVQDSTDDDEGGRARTDIVIVLPHNRRLIIDSKTPLEAFWEGMNAADEASRRERFASHARLVRDHARKLASKTYWARYPSAPDFTIMFLPTEGAYQAAFESDPDLIADCQKLRVYITSPMNLMSMVHAIAFVLREERLAQNAQLIQETAADLYARLSKFLDHVEKLGRNLRLTVENYNSAVGSLDTRVLPVARRMNAMGVSGSGSVDDVPPVEAVPRALASQERLLALPDDVIEAEEAPSQTHDGIGL